MSDTGEIPERRPTTYLVVEGRRAELERELMWTVALGGSDARIKEIERMLASAANDNVLLDVVRPVPGD